MQNYYMRVFLLLCTINVANLAFSSNMGNMDNIRADQPKTMRRNVEFNTALKHYELHKAAVNYLVFEILP